MCLFRTFAMNAVNISDAHHLHLRAIYGIGPKVQTCIAWVRRYTQMMVIHWYNNYLPYSGHVKNSTATISYVLLVMGFSGGIFSLDAIQPWVIEKNIEDQRAEITKILLEFNVNGIASANTLGLIDLFNKIMFAHLGIKIERLSKRTGYMLTHPIDYFWYGSEDGGRPRPSGLDYMPMIIIPSKPPLCADSYSALSQWMTNKRSTNGIKIEGASSPSHAFLDMLNRRGPKGCFKRSSYGIQLKRLHEIGNELYLNSNVPDISPIEDGNISSSDVTMAPIPCPNSTRKVDVQVATQMTNIKDDIMTTTLVKSLPMAELIKDDTMIQSNRGDVMPPSSSVERPPKISRRKTPHKGTYGPRATSTNEGLVTKVTDGCCIINLKRLMSNASLLRPDRSVMVVRNLMKPFTDIETRHVNLSKSDPVDIINISDDESMSQSANSPPPIGMIRSDTSGMIEVEPLSYVEGSIGTISSGTAEEPLYIVIEEEESHNLSINHDIKTDKDINPLVNIEAGRHWVNTSEGWTSVVGSSEVKNPDTLADQNAANWVKVGQEDINIDMWSHSPEPYTAPNIVRDVGSVIIRNGNISSVTPPAVEIEAALGHVERSEDIDKWMLDEFGLELPHLPSDKLYDIDPLNLDFSALDYDIVKLDKDSSPDVSLSGDMLCDDFNRTGSNVSPQEAEHCILGFDTNMMKDDHANVITLDQQKDPEMPLDLLNCIVDRINVQSSPFKSINDLNINSKISVNPKSTTRRMMR